ncbi:MAG TPA: type VI secretion system baseplate subunit TssE [Pirellulales bacterium]|jgi:type VI secretion system protein ImpF|nr:type VI secretion system baseplate subunit TssE [Pirellulales bacterium]
MAELLPAEKLQPSLLDRLTDDEPASSQESRSQRVLSVARLHQAVRRDLAWLLNTTSLSVSQPLDAYPLVAQSVVNFGGPDLTGVTLASLDLPELERLLRQAIWNFEPRLLRHSVKVSVSATSEMTRKALIFYVEGELWAQPVPQRLFLKTEIDLETGNVTMIDAGG